MVANGKVENYLTYTSVVQLGVSIPDGGWGVSRVWGELHDSGSTPAAY